MKLIPVSFAVALGLLVIAPAVATADSLGTQGYVDSVTLHDSWSDQYSTVHGEVVIREGQDANANKRTYKWGGSICQNQAISSSNARALLDMVNKDNLAITPRWKSGMGSTRCIVGFTVSVPPAAVAR
ncbi:MAG: hypothetical protein KC636_16355 [Myxococcales bacterium]|nr:hypothetical protein [Myxococcales bacterium]